MYNYMRNHVLLVVVVVVMVFVIIIIIIIILYWNAFSRLQSKLCHVSSNLQACRKLGLKVMQNFTLKH